MICHRQEEYSKSKKADDESCKVGARVGSSFRFLTNRVEWPFKGFAFPAKGGVMKRKAITGCIFALVLLVSMNASADWTENFEGYSSGAQPGYPWTYSGSSDISVVNSIFCEGSQSLQFRGPAGGCWESIPCRSLEVGTSGIFVIEFCAYIGSDHVQGCHSWTGGAGLMTACDWVTGVGVPIVNFWYDGHIDSRIGSLGTYSYDTWLRVKMKYERVDASIVRVSYWIDDVFKGIQDVAATPYEDELSYFHGSSGDGTVSFDDIKVTSSTIPEVIAYYPFNGNANDESGNEYHGTIYGASLASDRFGNENSAYGFNGSGDYIISNPLLPVGNSARSISIWFNTTSLSGSNGWLSNTAISWGSPFDNALCSITIYQGELWFGAFGNAYDVPTWRFVSDGDWHHVVVVYDGNILKVYLDTIEVAAAVRTLNTSSSSLYIGSRAGQGDQYMDGLLDDVRVFNRTLSKKEIQILYGEGDWNPYAALVNSIVDVPNDQGGWVLAYFTRSSLDNPEEGSLPISSYGI
ncbi:MAG: LamG domain-containing protein, partial [Candidatus Latescibacterota bacterium]